MPLNSIVILRPYRVEYAWGMFFLLGSSISSLAFPKLLGELVNSGNAGNLSNDLNRIGLLLVITLLTSVGIFLFQSCTVCKCY